MQYACYIIVVGQRRPFDMKRKTLADVDKFSHLGSNVICANFVSETEKAFCLNVTVQGRTELYPKNVWFPKSALRPATEADLNPNENYLGDFVAVCADWLVRAKVEDGVRFGGSYKVSFLNEVEG